MALQQFLALPCAGIVGYFSVVVFQHRDRTQREFAFFTPFRRKLAEVMAGLAASALATLIASGIYLGEPAVTIATLVGLAANPGSAEYLKRIRQALLSK